MTIEMYKSGRSFSVDTPERFHSLDALRGVAALGVVLWHWGHFFMGKGGPDVPKAQYPLYFIFRPFYCQGLRAVDLFFCLSGFVFYWLYAEKIASRRLAVREFAMLRFSRLYPLHFITLCFVAASQYLYKRSHGAYFIFPNNGMKEFFLQVPFASAWLGSTGFSFNGPVWSVSIEVLLYAVFFAACYVGLRRWWGMAAIAAAGFLLMWFPILPFQSSLPFLLDKHNIVGEGALCFFLGTIVYLAFDALRRRPATQYTVNILLAATVALWILIPANASLHLLSHAYSMFFSPVSGDAPVALPSKMIGAFTDRSYELVLFPLTVLALALAETFYRGEFCARLAPLGDISYSTYLLHFPLQLVFFAVAEAVGLGRSAFLSPATLILFFACLLSLSRMSYLRCERPVQNWIRSNYYASRVQATERT